jgi:hypothetical protein
MNGFPEEDLQNWTRKENRKPKKRKINALLQKKLSRLPRKQNRQAFTENGVEDLAAVMAMSKDDITGLTYQTPSDSDPLITITTQIHMGDRNILLTLQAFYSHQCHLVNAIVPNERLIQANE